jgi:hypothetical protein
VVTRNSSSVLPWWIRPGIFKEKLVSIVNGMLAEPDGPLRSNQLGLASESIPGVQSLRVTCVYNPPKFRTSARCAVNLRPEARQSLGLILKARDKL